MITETLDTHTTTAVEHVANRRRHPRKAVRHDTVVTVNGAQHHLKMTDLCAGGAFIETDLVLRPGNELQLVLRHFAYHGTARGRIIWGNNRGFGIAFVVAGRDFNETVGTMLTSRVE